MAAFDLSDFALLELTGEDRKEWLQGQATNDVRPLEPGGRTSFCFCEPTGQVLAVLDAWAFDDRIVMATARERVSTVLDRIERMTILEDVTARELPVEGLFLSETPPPDSSLLVLPSDRTAAGGWDVWGPAASIEGLREAFPRTDGEVERIGSGIPKWGTDVGPRTLPPELGPAFEATHVSYGKGCYTGQEVLMRMHARGHTNRTWVGLVSDSPLQADDVVRFEGKEVGRVSSAAPEPTESGAYFAAATLRNEATTDGTRVTAGETEAEVRTMPIVRGR